jgi:peroxiredoxin
MTQFESHKNEIEAAGAELVFIAAEKRDGVWKPENFLRKHPIASVFLLDEDRTVTKAYGLHHAFAPGAINIAHPATLIISLEREHEHEHEHKDDHAVVRYIYRGDNQFDRAPVDEVIGSLQK